MSAGGREVQRRILIGLLGDGNHIHTVWRDFSGDFGRDLLREHYSLASGASHRH
jgi:hypothetical protein